MTIDDQTRAKSEGGIARDLSSVFARQRVRLVDGGAAAGWADFQAEFVEALAARLQKIYEEAAMLALLLIAAGSAAAIAFLDRSPYKPDGASYGKRRAEELAKGIRDRVKGEVRDLRKAGDITPQSLSTTLGPSHAETIAVTETTAADSAGSADGVSAGKDLPGVEVITTIWVTERDARVCPICRPLDGVREENWPPAFQSGIHPPAHPNCRCTTKTTVTHKAQ